MRLPALSLPGILTRKFLRPVLAYASDVGSMPQAQLFVGPPSIPASFVRRSSSLFCCVRVRGKLNVKIFLRHSSSLLCSFEVEDDCPAEAEADHQLNPMWLEMLDDPDKRRGQAKSLAFAHSSERHYQFNQMQPSLP